MFSKACEYGIRAMIYIAHESREGKRASLKEVAEAIDSPTAFTAKILQALVKDELIASVKGAGGGYQIAPERFEKITLCHVVQSIDGDQIYKGCGLGLPACNEAKPCPVHYQFKVIRDELKTMLESTYVNDLAMEIHSGMAFLKQ